MLEQSDSKQEYSVSHDSEHGEDERLLSNVDEVRILAETANKDSNGRATGVENDTIEDEDALRSHRRSDIRSSLGLGVTVFFASMAVGLLFDRVQLTGSTSADHFLGCVCAGLAAGLATYNDII